MCVCVLERDVVKSGLDGWMPVVTIQSCVRGGCNRDWVEGKRAYGSGLMPLGVISRPEHMYVHTYHGRQLLPHVCSLTDSGLLGVGCLPARRTSKGSTEGLLPVT